MSDASPSLSPPVFRPLPGGLDAMAVGRSIFGGGPLPPIPRVPGYSDFVFLAQGGLGRVWRAIREADGTAVALKIARGGDADHAGRLMLEGDMLRGLDHPGIVRLYDFTEDEAGHPVLVMELIHGPALTAVLPERGFDFEDALQILLPVLEAVQHAHDRGIVHRDLKPSNILIGPDGRPKVTDFGLAKSLHRRQVGFSLTRSGVVAGTVEYLAPECYQPGREPGVKADIFALGIMLYELLTGLPPRGAWVPLSLVKKLDVRLDEVMSGAINPDPAARLGSAADLHRRLREIRDSRPRYAGTPLLTRPVRVADAVWTVAGLYLLAAGFCSLQRLNNTQVPAMFDLTFGHTRLLGGFWTVWTMTVGMGILLFWQAVRLWKFRRVPLREALPSPFGLRLGGTRGAAFLVGTAQMLCAWGPLYYLAVTAAATWHWITPGTPFWEKGLCVMKWDTVHTVSPWTWDPPAFFSGGAYWIREVRPGMTPGTWQYLDRQSFFIFTQPLLMAIGAVGISWGMAALGLAVFREWAGNRKISLFLVFVTVAAVSSYIFRELKAERSVRQGIERDHSRSISFSQEEILLGIKPKFERLIRGIYSPREGLEDFGKIGEDLFHNRILHNEYGSVARPDFLRRLQGGNREAMNFHAELLSLRMAYDWRVRPVSMSAEFEFYQENAEGQVSGSFIHVAAGGFIPSTASEYKISEWSSRVVPLYGTTIRDLGPSEAAGWLRTLLHSLGEAEGAGLESLLLPTVLAVKPMESWDEPTTRQIFLDAFRNERRRWRHLEFTLADPPPLVRKLSAGRWEISAGITHRGIRLDGSTESAAQPSRWKMEIVPIDSGWRILRLHL